MSESPRLTKLRELVAGSPGDAQARFFLAHELFKAERWAEAADEYDAYVRTGPQDAGAALKNLGLCQERLGQLALAAETYRRAIEAALANGHDGLAGEIRFLLSDLDA